MIGWGAAELASGPMFSGLLASFAFENFIMVIWCRGNSVAEWQMAGIHGIILQAGKPHELLALGILVFDFDYVERVGEFISAPSGLIQYFRAGRRPI